MEKDKRLCSGIHNNIWHSPNLVEGLDHRFSEDEPKRILCRPVEIVDGLDHLRAKIVALLTKR